MPKGGFPMNRERKLLIGKQLREGPLSAPDCMKKRGVGYTCVCTWRRADAIALFSANTRAAATDG